MVKTWIAFACACVFLAHAAWKTSIKPEPVEPWVTGSTIELIEYFEGKRHKAYRDSEGNWTIGVGHLIKRKDHHLLRVELSEEEVMGILHRDLQTCSETLQSVLNVGLKRPQIDALHSLCHNIGPDNFARSDVVKYMNRGEMEKAGNAFMNWSKPEVLKKRRQAEKALFLTGL